MIWQLHNFIVDSFTNYQLHLYQIPLMIMTDGQVIKKVSLFLVEVDLLMSNWTHESSSKSHEAVWRALIQLPYTPYMKEWTRDILNPRLVIWANADRITPELLQYRRLGLHHSRTLALCLTPLLYMILPIPCQQLPPLPILAAISQPDKQYSLPVSTPHDLYNRKKSMIKIV